MELSKLFLLSVQTFLLLFFQELEVFDKNLSVRKPLEKQMFQLPTSQSLNIYFTWFG